MRTICLVAVLAASALFFAFDTGAQSSLAERTAQLRREIQTTDTTAENFTPRIRLLEEWGGELAAQGRFHSPQMLMMAFYRNNDPNDPAVKAAVKRWVNTLAFLEANGARMGTMRRTDSNTLTAAVYGTLVLEYTVGEMEIPTGQGIRLGLQFFANRPRLQSTDPSTDNYVTFQVKSATAKGEAYSSYGLGTWSSIFLAAPMPAWKITSGSLRPGDKVIITVGDRTGGSFGYRPPPRDADDFKFAIEADFRGDGTFITAATASATVSGDEAAGVSLVVPSIAKTGEPFTARLRVEDQYWNPAKFSGGKFIVERAGAKVGEIQVAPNTNTGQLDGLRLDREGGYWFDVVSADGRMRAKSNPILVERNPDRRLYWGELHGHSGWEEGTGSVPGYYKFARTFAYLDFASLTGHDLFLCKPGWDEIRRETEKANRDGQFVAYMGYEWTQLYNRGGHHNVIFRNDKGRYAQARDYGTLPKLYARLREIDQTGNVLIIPHAHETGDWNYTDADMERLVEIFSFHGSFEYFGQRYLNRKYRTGFVAASDDHTGHPGYAPAGSATRGGLAAVYSPSLTREGIWDGMKDRATYATTNTRRPVMKVTMDNRRMGQAVDTGHPHTINARVLGTGPIDRVEVVYNNQLAYSQDYLTPRPGEPSGLQVLLNTATETPGDTVAPPLSGTFWGGWIEVSDGRIASIEGLGLDHYTDQFRLVNERQIAFWCKTRGDVDGVLIKFAEQSAKTKVTVIVSSLDIDAPGTGGQRAVVLPPLLPSRTPRYTVTLHPDSLSAKRAEHAITPQAKIIARKTRLFAPWDVSFQYRPTQPPKQDDFYYVRMIQLDGEAAWSSPIWVGEEKKR